MFGKHLGLGGALLAERLITGGFSRSQAYGGIEERNASGDRIETARRMGCHPDNPLVGGVMKGSLSVGDIVGGTVFGWQRR